jgi:hypothetical protein
LNFLMRHTGEGRYPGLIWTPASAGVTRRRIRFEFMGSGFALSARPGVTS